uniref:Putative secreted protein n=1 Tax=Anopheles darlingi TaxID=43151 RepID=A0A2M4DRJ3_ANODA
MSAPRCGAHSGSTTAAFCGWLVASAARPINQYVEEVFKRLRSVGRSARPAHTRSHVLASARFRWRIMGRR